MNVKLSDCVKIPNLLSLARIVLLWPFIILFSQKIFWPTLVIILVMIATDYLDGWSSRKLNQVTETGKVLDPLSDKITLGVGLFILFQQSGVFLWPLFVLIGRDILIVIMGVFIAKKTDEVPSSNMAGKLTSVFLSLTGVCFFIWVFYPSKILRAVSMGFYFISIAFIGISSVLYFMKAVQLLKGVKKN